MYSREERLKVIELYLKYNKSTSDVINKLGYPDPKSLRKWYKDYLMEKETGIERNLNKCMQKYSYEQKKVAIDHFYEHGCNISRTVSMIGYPSRATLRNWCEQLTPWTRSIYTSGIQYSKENKIEAVLDLCTRNGSACDVASQHGVNREMLYRWKDSLLNKEVGIKVKKKKDKYLKVEKEVLRKEAASLKQQVERLKLEKAILEGTVETIKKDQGVEPIKRLIEKRQKWPMP